MARSRHPATGAGLLSTAVAAFAFALPATAQELALSYTEAQAAEGRRIYDIACVTCHGPNLDDGPLGAPLKGVAFMEKYGGRSVAHLFETMRATMPTGSPGALDDAGYAALTALILQANSIVAGETELPPDVRTLRAMSIPAGGFSFMAFSPYTEREIPERPSPLDGFTPVTDETLADPPAGDWLTWRRSYDAHGFSPLAQIDARNVHELRVAWSWTLPAGSAEGVPLVRDGTLFAQAYGDVVQALDAKTGDLLWEYRHALEPGATPFHKRGIALHGERLYVGTSDVHVVALDVHTGEVVWDTRIGEFREREGLNGGPLVARGKVMVGTTGTGVGAKPGGPQIVGLDAETGAIVARVRG
ncbi:MAG TPA: PQQ-binding-like beta-propeller repeat protein [Gammaproteobacteria bacterium]